MLNVSNEFKRAIRDNTKTLFKARLTLASKKVINLVGDDVMTGSASFSHSTSSSGSFDIGACIIGSFSCTLNNYDGRFDDCDFTGSMIEPQVGVELADGSVEWLRMGTYWPDQPETYGMTIGLSCYDAICKLDVPFADVGQSLPASASTVVRAICNHCGISLLTSVFDNNDVVLGKPSNASVNCMSCRSALSHVAQATGNFVCMTTDNRLKLAWYDIEAFSEIDSLDGGQFDVGTPYRTGDAADGGDFLDYSTGDGFDGGTFTDFNIVYVTTSSSVTVATDDVCITGVSVTAADEVKKDGSIGENGESVLVGQKGYVLGVTQNPFIPFGKGEYFAQLLYKKVGGMTFRPFDVSRLGDPTIQAGDAAIVVDRFQREYRGWITTRVYKIGAYMALSCSAESPIRRAAMGEGAVTAAIQESKNQLRQEKSAREIALEQLNADLASSSGIFKTATKDSSGASTWFIHDKKRLADSEFVWKINAGGFGMSIDGGKSFQFGLDKWGNAILHEIYAIGLDASYITAGKIEVKSNKKTVFCVDVDSGQFWWDAQYSSLTNQGSLTVEKGKIGGFSIDKTKIYNDVVSFGNDGLKVTKGTVGGFTIDSSSISNNGLKLYEKGLYLNYKNKSLGIVGANSYRDYPDIVGLNFDLETSGDYMSWGYKYPGDEVYKDIIVYAARAFGSYSENTLNVCCDLDMRWHKIIDTNIDLDTLRILGSYSGTLRFVTSAGFITGTNTLLRYLIVITVKSGIVTSITADPYNE